MKLVYIAGPYRAANAWDREQNIRRAEEAALEILRLGASVICPHTMSRFYQDAITDERALAATKEMLLRCDAIYMLHGWDASTESIAELHQAAKQCMPIFYQAYGLEPLLFWLEHGYCINREK